MHQGLFRAVQVASLVCITSSPIRGQRTQPLAAESIQQINHVSDIQLAPDGSAATLVLRLGTGGTPEKEAGAHIWLRSTKEQGDLHILSGTDSNDHSPLWSPDGRLIAFLSSRKAGNVEGDQVYIVPSGGGTAKRLTDIPGGVSWFAWSPDGTMVAFLAPDAAGTASSSQTTTPSVIDQPFVPSRLWVTSIADGKSVVAASMADDIEDFAWSPDGRFLAILTDSAPAADGKSSIALRVIQRLTGRVVRQFVVDALDSSQVLRWSPDGKLIVFQERTPLPNGVLWSVVPADGSGPAHPLLRDFIGSILQVEFGSDSRHAFAEIAMGTRQRIVDLSTLNDTMETIAEINAPTSDFQFSTNGHRFLYLSQTASSPNEVWTVEQGHKPVRLTDLDPQISRWDFGEVSELHWTDRKDGLPLNGILIRPVGFDPTKKYPMVVLMHPGDMPWWYGFHFSWWDWGQLLATRGFVVFMPNYRGVVGQGWKLQSHIGDWGLGLAMQDMLDGVDAVLRQGFVDAGRLGIAGWSNGGFMTEWTITHTDRFKAAVAEAGMSDFFAMYGNPDGNRTELRGDFGTSPYSNRSVFDAHSPITYVRACHTPTLLLHGEEDRNVPVGQAYEFHTALKELGIETNLVIYPGEGHSIGSPDDRIDVENRVAAWFASHLQ